MTRITVLESVPGKFGPQLKDKDGYLNFGKFYKGETTFPPGTVLTVDLFTSAKGARYINSAEVFKEGNTTAVSPSHSAKPSGKKAAVVESPPSVGRNYDKENRGKVKSLFLEAMLSNPNVTICAEDINKLNSPEIQKALNELVESVF